MNQAFVFSSQQLLDALLLLHFNSNVVFQSFTFAAILASVLLLLLDLRLVATFLTSAELSLDAPELWGLNR